MRETERGSQREETERQRDRDRDRKTDRLSHKQDRQTNTQATEMHNLFIKLRINRRNRARR